MGQGTCSRRIKRDDDLDEAGSWEWQLGLRMEASISFLIGTDLLIGWVSLFWFGFLNVFHYYLEGCQILVENGREEIDFRGFGCEPPDLKVRSAISQEQLRAWGSYGFLPFKGEASEDPSRIHVVRVTTRGSDSISHRFTAEHYMAPGTQTP